MSERFYVPDLAADASVWTLVGDEARHLAKVMRAKPGDAIELFDGVGLCMRATVESVGKRTVDLALGTSVRTAKPGGLTLGTAFPKGERTDWLIEKAVELGVARLAPLKTARSVAAAGEGKLERLERKIVEACKQCRRDWLMELAAPTPLADFLASKPPAVVGWLLDPSGEPADGRCDWAAVGPEGGFTAAELEAAHATGWKIVALPGHILRIETACLAVAAKALSGGL